MGNDAISNTKKTDLFIANSNSSVSASPLIIIIGFIAILGTVLFLFKDKIFKKKNQNLDELNEKAKQEIQEPQPEEKQETLSKEESEKIEDKFSHN